MGYRCKLFKAVAVRVLFFLHISVSLYWLYEEYDRQIGWWLIFGLAGVLLGVEASFTLCCNKHGEWRRFFPCIFIYLVGVVPVLCLIEWSHLNKRIEYKKQSGQCPSITSNSTFAFSFTDANGDTKVVTSLDYNWSLALQQVLVFLLVAGRWFLPKGKMSRETLSNLLLAYVGMAADILDFLSEGVQSDAVRCDRIVVLLILCLWAISLVQFTFGLSHQGRGRSRSKSISRVNENLFQRCRSSEVWGIIFIIVLQDGPFLVMRLYLIARFKILEQGLLFFTFKNILVVMLQLYRLWILLCMTWNATEGGFSHRIVASIRNKGRVNDIEDRRESMPYDEEGQPQDAAFAYDNDAVFQDETEIGRSHRNLAQVVDNRPQFEFKGPKQQQTQTNVPTNPPAYQESNNDMVFPPHLPQENVHHHHVHDHYHDYIPRSHPSYLDSNNLPPRNARRKSKKSSFGKKQGRQKHDRAANQENWQMYQSGTSVPVRYEDDLSRHQTSNPYNKVSSWASHHFGGTDAPLY